MARVSFGKFDAVNFDSLLENFEKERFLKNCFSLAVVDGRQRRLCILMLATSGKPRTLWALQLTRTALIRASESDVLADHVLFQLSSLGNLLSGLDL